ncbi:MAG: Septin 4, partial [Paramarteilia canceri]
MTLQSISSSSTASSGESQYLLSKLKNQLYRYCCHNPARFNILILGHPCTGKDSFINSLFGERIYNIESKVYDPFTELE